MAKSDAYQEREEQPQLVELDGPPTGLTSSTWQLPIGRFDEYDPSSEEWVIYQERIEQFIDVSASPVKTSTGAGPCC